MSDSTPDVTRVVPSFPPDKVHVSAYYDEGGACHSIDVTLNYDGISREDLTETIRAVFHPQPVMVADGTFRHRELGSTDVIRMAGRDSDRGISQPMPMPSRPHVAR